MATLLGASSCAAVTTSISYPAIQKEAVFNRRSLTAVIRKRSTGQCGSQQQAFRAVRHGVQKNAKVLQRHTIVRSQALEKALEEEPPTVDNSTVLVVGGGGLGLDTFRALSTAGSWVTVYQRSDKFRKDIEGLGAMLAIGDALDPQAVAKTVNSNSFDAIVCTVGGGQGGNMVDTDGPVNFIDAAKKAGVKRFILISSIGAGDSQHALKEDVYKVLKNVLVAKGKAEEYLKASGLDYTIIRPGGLLKDGTATGKGILTEDTSVSGLISRPDVASLILKILFDKRTSSKTYSSIDVEKPFPGTRTEDIELLALA